MLLLRLKNLGKVFVLGNYIFLNEIDKGVHIIDNKNPSAPVNKYFVAIPGNLDLAVKGNTLYADSYRDLLTLDISDPDNVQVKKTIENIFPAKAIFKWLCWRYNKSNCWLDKKGYYNIK